MRSQIRISRRSSVSSLVCVVLVLMTSGCASSRRAVRKVDAFAECVDSVSVERASPSRDAAIVLGRRLLESAVPPPGAVRLSRQVPSTLGGVLPGPNVGNLVCANRAWIVPRRAAVVRSWLQSHTPRDYSARAANLGPVENGVPSGWVEDDLAILPANTSAAELLFEISGDESGRALVRVDAVVGWTMPRPANEFVPPLDHVVTATVLHVILGSSAEPVLGKQVVVTDPHLVHTLVDGFNRLRVEPPQGPMKGYECGPGGERLAYRVAFSATPTSPPDITATLGPCEPHAEVTVHDKPATGLLLTGPFEQTVTQQALGIRPQ